MKEIEINGRTYVLEEGQIVHNWDNGLAWDNCCYKYATLYRVNRKTYILDAYDGAGCPLGYMIEGMQRALVAAGWLSKVDLAKIDKTENRRQRVTVDQYSHWYVMLTHAEAQAWITDHQSDQLPAYYGSSVTH